MQDESSEKRSLFAIFSECKSSLSSVVRRYSNRHHDVEDILQEAFLNAFLAEKSKPIHAPKKYLYTVTKNLAIRENSKVATKLTEFIDDHADPLLLSNEDDLFEQLSAEQERQLLLEALNQLPSQCQQVTRLRLINGIKVKDIALMLNLSIKTVEKHMAKGLERCDEYILHATSSLVEDSNQFSQDATANQTQRNVK
ncbi:hypothetical protein HR45_18800 [Shewanella mangrovi]|uniref:RNA polymerase sigma factor n=1 Tax=Shewanella mangrovi TaxID=1515746 RepID=A0A094J7V0_9GAMM|nr:sigma-70 family RNA polymerase sigma factor [Shewanella mangrovi]KFZ36000.1 hypothetical protein HR45_18800 [Shewanella mangrovi]